MSRRLERIHPPHFDEALVEPLDDFLGYVEAHTEDNYRIHARDGRTTAYTVEENSHILPITGVVFEQVGGVEKDCQVAALRLLGSAVNAPAEQPAGRPLLKLVYESVFKEAWFRLEDGGEPLVPVANPEVVTRTLRCLRALEENGQMTVVERQSPHPTLTKA